MNRKVLFLTRKVKCLYLFSIEPPSTKEIHPPHEHLVLRAGYFCHKESSSSPQQASVDNLFANHSGTSSVLYIYIYIPIYIHIYIYSAFLPSLLMYRRHIGQLNITPYAAVKVAIIAYVTTRVTYSNIQNNLSLFRLK